MGRKYTIGNSKFPSVSTVLSETASYQQQMNLQQWLKKDGNPEKAEYSRSRGTTLHSYAQSYLLDQQFDIDPQFQAMWDSLKLVLDPIKKGQKIWVEAPILKEHAHAYALRWDDGNVIKTSCVWSERGFAGCPDIVVNLDGATILYDLKTSDTAYQSRKPPFDEERGNDWRSKTSGFHKFERAAIQIAAYAEAIKHTLEIEVVQRKIIIVIDQAETACKTYTIQDHQKYDDLWSHRLGLWKKKNA